jgi:hypothetical protein
MATPGSRFAGLPVVASRAPDGTPRPTIALRLERSPAPDPPERHRLRQGEQVDLIAREAYGSERLWWHVLDGNPLLHPFDLRPGDVLAVPPIAEAGRANRARDF